MEERIGDYRENRCYNQGRRDSRMLSALILAGLIGIQNPPLTDDAAVRAARVLINVFDLDVELFKIERNSESELADVHVVFQSSGAGLYRVSVDSKTHKADSIQVIEEYVGPTRSNIGEATAQEIEYALGIMRETHPAHQVQPEETSAYVIPDGRTRVTVTSTVLLDKKRLYVGSNWYPSRRRISERHIPSYGLTIASIEFERDSGFPVRYSIAHTDYIFDATPPIANKDDIRFASRREFEEFVRARDKRTGSETRHGASYMSPIIVWLVAPGERTATLCYSVTVSEFLPAEYGIGPYTPSYTLFFDGQTGEYLPSGSIE